MELYHQTGFRYKWNLSSFKEDNVGNGIILAPRYIKSDAIENFDHNLKENCLFDPQLYLPGTAKGKLETFDYHPINFLDKFDTTTYSEEYALAVARKCISYQVDNSFKYIIVPTRYYEGMPANFIESQNEQFVQPFLKVAEELGVLNKVVIQVILNNLMFNEDGYVEDVINWVTGLDVAGVYLIPDSGNNVSKQIKDYNYLTAVINLIRAIKYNDLKIIVGFSNTELLLYSIFDPDILTIGAYENLRAFNIEAFKDVKRDQRGPNPRVYSPKLLQWIEYPYINAIERANFEIDLFFGDNKYNIRMFKPDYNWHFTKPEIYKHYFLEMDKQFSIVRNIDLSERMGYVYSLIEEAILQFNSLKKAGIAFDHNSDDSHLYIWKTVLDHI